MYTLPLIIHIKHKVQLEVLLMDKKGNGEKEILACNKEVSKDLFMKELYAIVDDGARSSVEDEEKSNKDA